MSRLGRGGAGGGGASASGSGGSGGSGGGQDTIPALALAAERFGDRLALDDGESRFSYAALLATGRRFGAALVGTGIEPGDRVAIWAFNCAEWVIALLGLSAAGATLIPVNTRLKGTEAAGILRRSKARVLVTVSGFLGNDYVELLRTSGVELPDLRLVVIARGEPAEDTVSWSNFLAGSDNDSLAQLERRAGAVRASDVSDILFTSGTTGAPKGVVMTHDRTLRVATDWVAMTQLCGDDRYLMVNPFFHMFGLKAGILACLTSGAAMFPEPTFDVARALQRTESHAITVLPGAPTLYQAILDLPERRRYDLSSLRVAVTGAADIPVELIKRVREELPFSLVVTGYGLTEAGTATSTAPGDDFETIATTVGRPRPGFELRLVEDKVELEAKVELEDKVEGAAQADEAPVQTGEILLRGPSVMSHYLDDAEATETAFAPGGWLRTGDLGSIDAAGNLRIVGRTKDMFIVGGFNAYPAEIENLLLGHPAVAQVAVIGVPDERLGEVCMAFVVPQAGADPSEDEIVAWSRVHMANYKVPRRVEIVAELPLNATGKVQKDVLRGRAAESRTKTGPPV